MTRLLLLKDNLGVDAEGHCVVGVLTVVLCRLDQRRRRLLLQLLDHLSDVTVLAGLLLLTLITFALGGLTFLSVFFCLDLGVMSVTFFLRLLLLGSALLGFRLVTFSLLLGLLSFTLTFALLLILSKFSC